MDGLRGAFANAFQHCRVLAEDLVIEGLYAERDLVALVLRGLDRVGGVGRVIDGRLRRGSGFGRCRGRVSD